MQQSYRPGLCGICHVRHTATIQAKRDATTSTLSLREKIFRRVSRCSIMHRGVNVMRIVLLILIMFMCMMSGCRTVSVGSITLCETGYKALQWAYMMTLPTMCNRSMHHYLLKM